MLVTAALSLGFLLIVQALHPGPRAHSLALIGGLLASGKSVVFGAWAIQRFRLARRARTPALEDAARAAWEEGMKEQDHRDPEASSLAALGKGCSFLDSRDLPRHPGVRCAGPTLVTSATTRSVFLGRSVEWQYRGGSTRALGRVDVLPLWDVELAPFPEEGHDSSIALPREWWAVVPCAACGGTGSVVRQRVRYETGAPQMGVGAQGPGLYQTTQKITERYRERCSRCGGNGRVEVQPLIKSRWIFRKWEARYPPLAMRASLPEPSDCITGQLGATDPGFGSLGPSVREALERFLRDAVLPPRPRENEACRHVRTEWRMDRHSALWALLNDGTIALDAGGKRPVYRPAPPLSRKAVITAVLAIAVVLHVVVTVA